MDIEQITMDLHCVCGQREMKSEDSIKDVLARLDASARSEDFSAQLKHYLAQRSYMKALAWIKDSSTPRQL